MHVICRSFESCILNHVHLIYHLQACLSIDIHGTYISYQTNFSKHNCNSILWSHFTAAWTASFATRCNKLHQTQPNCPTSFKQEAATLFALWLHAGAQTLVGLNRTGYAGGAVQFTTAASQSVAIQRCLQEARVNASMPAASAATLARAALLSGNATAAAQAIQSALCSANTATATAEAFAEVIGSSVGCNGTVQSALQCKHSLAAASVHHVRAFLE